MTDLITNLRPYFLSFREIENNFFLDLKIPKHWIYNIDSIDVNSIYIHPNNKEIDEVTGDKNIFITFFLTSLNENIEKIFNYGEILITFNKNNEIKKDLFNKKVKELELLFEKESIDNLKDLRFNEKI